MQQVQQDICKEKVLFLQEYHHIGSPEPLQLQQVFVHSARTCTLEVDKYHVKFTKLHLYFRPHFLFMYSAIKATIHFHPP